MYDIDFTIPYWLITYYHVIGIISLMFDTFSIYLVLFKSSKIDNFRYFLLNFQVSRLSEKEKIMSIRLLVFQLACAVTDVQLTFLMQPVPLYPLVSGYILGFLSHFGVTTHNCMVGLDLFYLLIAFISTARFLKPRSTETEEKCVRGGGGGGLATQEAS